MEAPSVGFSKFRTESAIGGTTLSATWPAQFLSQVVDLDSNQTCVEGAGCSDCALQWGIAMEGGSPAIMGAPRRLALLFGNGHPIHDRVSLESNYQEPALAVRRHSFAFQTSLAQKANPREPSAMATT